MVDEMSGLRFLKKPFEIERFRAHVQSAVWSPRPLLLGPVPIKLDSIPIGIAQIQRFTHAVVRCAFEWNACLNQAAQSIGEFGPSWINDREMVKARRSAMRRRTAVTFPGIQSDMMMIATSRKERRLLSVALREFESEHIPIKRKRPIKIGDLQMNVSDADIRMKRF